MTLSIGDLVTYRIAPHPSRTAQVMREGIHQGIGASGFWGKDILTERIIWVYETEIVSPFQRILDTWTPAQRQQAQHVVNAYQHEEDQFRRRLELPYHQSTDYRFKALCKKEIERQEYEQELSCQEFKQHAEARSRHWLELDAWIKRQSVLHADIGGATVLQSTFNSWLKRLKKALPREKDLKALRMYYARPSQKDEVSFLDSITLDCAAGFLSAHHWTVSNGELGLATFRERLPCLVPAPFTARVDFETLQEVVGLMSPETLALKREGVTFTIGTAYNHNHLKHQSIAPITVRYWLGEE